MSLCIGDDMKERYEIKYLKRLLDEISQQEQLQHQVVEQKILNKQFEDIDSELTNNIGFKLTPSLAYKITKEIHRNLRNYYKMRNEQLLEKFSEMLDARDELRKEKIQQTFEEGEQK